MFAHSVGYEYFNTLALLALQYLSNIVEEPFKSSGPNFRNYEWFFFVFPEGHLEFAGQNLQIQAFK